MASPRPAISLRIQAMQEYDLRLRTPSEELWLWRRRQISPSGRTRSRVGSGLSQLEAANALGISMQRYHDAEAGRLPERDVHALFVMAQKGQVYSNPTLGELCALARRRAGWTLEYSRETLGKSRVTFLELERIGDPSILEMWMQEGFVF